MYSKEKFEAGYAANVKAGLTVKPHDEAWQHYCKKRHLDPAIFMANHEEPIDLANYSESPQDESPPDAV
jgi:hypothetical protein